jgi:hypothetical protein
VNAPAPPASHFRELVAGNPAPPGSSDDPEEYERRRLRLADRHGAARTVLMQTSLLALNIVEMVAIDRFMPGFLRAGHTPSVALAQDLAAFIERLRALADLFETVGRRKRRRDHSFAASEVQTVDAS